MADQKGISKLDEKLIGDQIIPESFSADLPLVHKKMNAILKKTGGNPFGRDIRNGKHCAPKMAESPL